MLLSIQIEALQEVLEKLRSKEMPSEKKLGWLPSVSGETEFINILRFLAQFSGEEAGNLIQDF